MKTIVVSKNKFFEQLYEEMTEDNMVFITIKKTQSANKQILALQKAKGNTSIKQRYAMMKAYQAAIEQNKRLVSVIKLITEVPNNKNEQQLVFVEAQRIGTFVISLKEISIKEGIDVL